jgi:hypothetical protein
MFKLYAVQEHTFPFADYGKLIEEVQKLGAKTALEFGPGISTLALIESGLERIVTCEHDDEWFEKAKEKFREYPQVEVVRYWDEPEATSEAVGVFDVGFVDSPKGFTHLVPSIRGTRKKHPGQEDCSRLNTCLLALKHAPVVYLHDTNRPLERGTLGRLNKMGHKHIFIPGRAGFARIERGKDPHAVGTQGAQELGGLTPGGNAQRRGVQFC